MDSEIRDEWNCFVFGNRGLTELIQLLELSGGKHSTSVTVYRNFASAAVASHCCGNESLPWFPFNLWSCFVCTDSVEWMLWVEKQRPLASTDHSQWRKWRGRDVRVALRGSFRCNCNTVFKKKKKSLPFAASCTKNKTFYNWPVDTEGVSDQTTLDPLGP